MKLLAQIGACLSRLAEALGGWLGIDPERNGDDDPLATPVLSSEWVGRIERGEETCPHWDSIPRDDLPLEDPNKVWRCGMCGLSYRIVLDPRRPWVIRSYEPTK